MTVPMTTDTSVARMPMSSEIQAPATMRLKMSRPLTGSTPSRYSPLMPPKSPLGSSVLWSIWSWWNSRGGWPIRLMMGVEKIAISTSRITVIPPASATLSRRSRIQAIRLRERP